MRAICAIVASLVLAGTTFADTINVPGDYPFIQWAIDASSDGDVIQIAAGRFDQEGLISLNKAITIQGTLNSNGSLATTVASTFYCGSGSSDDAVIKDLIITKEGVSWSGSGVSIYNSSVTVIGCRITDNTEAGIRISGSLVMKPQIINCTITNNTAKYPGGGGILCYKNANITGCMISGNFAIGGGSATEDGGGIWLVGSSPTINDCMILDNFVDGEGGGIYCRGDSNPSINNCTISGNSAEENGGGISCLEDSSPTITSCTITNNIAQDFGGGLFILDNSNPEIEDTTVCGNTPSQILGSWIDNGSNSVTEVCSGGACCLEEECSVTTESDCTATGGNYLGDGTGCSLDPCNVPPGPGACCTNNNCIVVQEADCLLFFGQWLGDGTTCDDASCPTDCEGDTNGDGEVSVNDILIVIAQFGVTCP